MRAKLKTWLGKDINKLWALILVKKQYFFFSVIALILAYVFGLSVELLEGMAVISVLFFLASISIIYKRYFRAPPAFELMTFGTVVVTAKYGLIVGMFFGALSQIVAEIVSGAIDAQIVIFVPARTMLAVWTSIAVNIFVIKDVFILGMIAIAAYNLMVQPISFIMGDAQLKAKTIYYTIVYTIANFFVFSILSGPVSTLLRMG
ncbi:hypothetical protein HY640_02135 [Candidatus Woesearchaeota archaeon]|nr:hypothetical protein [Candidatus Woesearchaeota archaeon]